MRKIMKGKKIVVVLLALCVLWVASLSLVACGEREEDGSVEVPQKDKAIIYVTALFAGGLYDKETQEAKWEPFKTEIDAAKVMTGEIPISEILEIYDEELPDIVTLVTEALDYTPGSLLWDLTLDNDGNGYNPNVVPANDLPKYMDIDYGVFGIYRNFADNISKKYGDEYDVFVYNQDWRISPAKSAQELENYINRKGYKDVIFMSHSMGAPVVNNYLARSQANRDKVKLYMGFAPATLGSFDALAALACPDVYVNNFLEGVDLSGLPSWININNIVGSFLNGELGDFFRNNQGLMSLVPSWQLIDSDQYDDIYPAISVDDEPITSKEQLYELYASMRWAKYLTPKTQEEKESPDYDGLLYNRVLATEGQPADKDGYRIKDFAANLSDYFDGMFVNGKIASESVNSYYFLGTNMYNTITGMNLTTKTDAQGNVLYDEYGCVQYDYELLTGYGTGKMGDGTVPYYSSIGGNTATPEYISSLGDRLVELSGKNHGIVGCSWDLLGTYVMNLLEQYA